MVYPIIVTVITYTSTIIPDTVDVSFHILEIYNLFVEFYTLPFYVVNTF